MTFPSLHLLGTYPRKEALSVRIPPQGPLHQPGHSGNVPVIGRGILLQRQPAFSWHSPPAEGELAEDVRRRGEACRFPPVERKGFRHRSAVLVYEVLKPDVTEQGKFFPGVPGIVHDRH